MTVGDVKARVAEIEATKGDDESAHGMEDSLWADVLRAISQGDYPGDVAELAAEALRTEDIGFARWCA